MVLSAEPRGQCDALWIEQVYTVHVLDHLARREGRARAASSVIANEYL
jgi:hypothetical protein